jgi:hypothetical protein
MKVLQIGGIIVATTITAVFPIGKNLSAKANAAVEAEIIGGAELFGALCRAW